MRVGVRETGEEEREGRGCGGGHRRRPEVEGRTAARRPPESPATRGSLVVLFKIFTIFL